MILESFATITEDLPSWTREEESLAHDMNLIFTSGSCHCAPGLCAAWKRKIMANPSGYEFNYALNSARTAPVRN